MVGDDEFPLDARRLYSQMTFRQQHSQSHHRSLVGVPHAEIGI